MRDPLLSVIASLKREQRVTVEQENVGAVALTEFFAEPSSRPPLPGPLLPFTLLYRLALRDGVPDAVQVVATIEEAAAIELGERKGRIWANVLADHLAELSQVEQAWIDASVPDTEEPDPFGDLGENVQAWRDFRAANPDDPSVCPEFIRIAIEQEEGWH